MVELSSIDCEGRRARSGTPHDRACATDARGYDSSGCRASHHQRREFLTMSIVLGPNQYGKAENRVVRIYRDNPRHEIRDINVSTSLRGDFSGAHLHGDQTRVLPTD